MSKQVGAVRAKFTVTERTETYNNPDGAFVKLEALWNDGDPENKTFWDATPIGELTMTITNPGAAQLFKAGKVYYLDFTPAE